MEEGGKLKMGLTSVTFEDGGDWEVESFHFQKLGVRIIKRFQEV